MRGETGEKGGHGERGEMRRGGQGERGTGGIVEREKCWRNVCAQIQMERGEDKDNVQVSCSTGNTDKLLPEVKLVYRDPLVQEQTDNRLQPSTFFTYT